MPTHTVTLPAGAIHYTDSGGNGPVVLLCHGLLMDHTVWDLAALHMTPGVRLIRPTFPVGSHLTSMNDDADLSVRGQGKIVSTLLETLDLNGVTLVVSDLAYPLRLVTDQNPRVSRLVLLPSELYDNMPPGLPGKTIGFAGRVPGGLFVSIQSLRLPGAAKMPFTLGRLAKSIPPDILRGWIASPRKDREVRYDLAKYVRAADFDDIGDISQALETCPIPTLIIWSKSDKVMPFRGAERLARMMPNAELRAFDRGSVLLQLDEPQAVAELISRFVLQPDEPS